MKGTSGWARTTGLDFRKVALSPLSYGRLDEGRHLRHTKVKLVPRRGFEPRPFLVNSKALCRLRHRGIELVPRDRFERPTRRVEAGRSCPLS